MQTEPKAQSMNPEIEAACKVLFDYMFERGLNNLYIAPDYQCHLNEEKTRVSILVSKGEPMRHLLGLPEERGLKEVNYH